MWISKFLAVHELPPKLRSDAPLVTLVGVQPNTQAPFRSDPKASLGIIRAMRVYIIFQQEVRCIWGPTRSIRSQTNPLVRIMHTVKREIRKEAAIAKAAAGATKTSATRTAGVNRKTLYRWLEANLHFLMEFDAASTAGAEQRSYFTWLHHPLRGLRPPSGKGTQVRPRVSF